jgi:hypothetical protein
MDYPLNTYQTRRTSEKKEVYAEFMNQLTSMRENENKIIQYFNGKLQKTATDLYH